MSLVLGASSLIRPRSLVRPECMVLGAALIASVFAPVARAEVIDRVMAVAAGQLILMSDVTAARELQLVQPPAGPDPTAAVLQALIDRALVLAEVDRYAPPEPGADAVDRAVDAVRARFASPQDFGAALARFGIDENRLRQTLREDLRIRAYEDQRFTAPSRAGRDGAVAEWIAGLRRRAQIIDLYSARR